MGIPLFRRNRKGGEVMKNYFKYFLSICFIIGLCLHSEFVFAESLKGNALKQGIYKGLKKLLSHKDLLNYYKSKAKERGKRFNKENTIMDVENLLDNI